jgi:hypothetical protein
MNTIDRDHIRRGMELARSGDANLSGDLDPADFNLGVSGDRITTTVDVRDFLDVKRRSMAAHASQISETSFFLAMEPDAFVHGFGQEWYILEGAPPGTAETDLLEGLT